MLKRRKRKIKNTETIKGRREKHAQEKETD